MRTTGAAGPADSTASRMTATAACVVNLSPALRPWPGRSGATDVEPGQDVVVGGQVHWVLLTRCHAPARAWSASWRRRYANAAGLRLTVRHDRAISPEELRDALGSVVLVDVQWSLTAVAGPPGRELFETGHLAGAHHVDLDAEALRPARPRRSPPRCRRRTPSSRRCAGAGVDDDSAVVVYDQGPCMAAARAWWVFCYFGLGYVRVLDGGLAAWRASGGTLTDEVPEPGRGASPPASAACRSSTPRAAEVARLGVLLDARAVERYAGETEPIDRVAGRIPGAVRRSTAENTGADGRFSPTTSARPVRPARRPAGQAGRHLLRLGVTAAHQALALHEIGIEAPLYVGSWSHWIRDPGRPVSTGRLP